MAWTAVPQRGPVSSLHGKCGRRNARWPGPVRGAWVVGPSLRSSSRQSGLAGTLLYAAFWIPPDPGSYAVRVPAAWALSRRGRHGAQRGQGWDECENGILGATGPLTELGVVGRQRR